MCALCESTSFAEHKSQPGLSGGHLIQEHRDDAIILLPGSMLKTNIALAPNYSRRHDKTCTEITN